MLHLYDRATMAHALTLELNPQLHRLLASRITALSSDGCDLTDSTEYLVIEAGDTEADIVRHIGFSPLIEPIQGARYGSALFFPFWDWLGNHGGWFEMIVTFGSTFAYIVFIADDEGVPRDILAMCREYAGGPL